MKKHHNLFTCLVVFALAASGMSLGACKKIKQHRQDVATGAAVNTLMMTNPMGALLGNSEVNESGVPSRAPAMSAAPGCPTIDSSNLSLSLNIPTSISMTGNINLAYNNDCIIHGMQMSGGVNSQWAFNFNFLSLDLSLHTEIDFDNLTMEGRHTDGTITQDITIVNHLPTALINGSLETTHADGKTRKMEFDDLTATVSLHNYAKFEQFFHGCSITITDNDTIALEINGNGQYTDEDGMVSQMTFTNVKQPFGCVMPSSGQLHLVNQLKNYDAQIDYGDGTCDTLITIAVNGGDPEEIDVREWMEEHHDK